MIRAPIMLLAASMLMAGSAQAAPCKNVITVALAANGGVTVDDVPVRISALNDTLAGKKAGARAVFYYREDPHASSDPLRQAQIIAVMDAVARLNLPVSMSAKPDFSDVVDDQGRSSPRTSCPGGN